MATWKKILIGAGAFIVVLGLSLGITLYVAFGDVASIEDGAEVGPATTVMDAGYVAAYVLDAPDGGVVLVDAGTDAAASAIEAELERRGKTPDDVVAVLLTHGHPDHAGGLAAFESATVYAHPDDVDLIEGRQASQSPIGRIAGAAELGRVDERVGDDDVLDVAGLRVRVYAVPGHTQGSVAYLVDEATLFLGDAAMRLNDGSVRGPPWAFTWDRTMNDASVARLVERLDDEGVDVGGLAFGHSAAADDLTGLRTFAASVP